jgi:carbon-monoxide dehydrogenase large subunit
VVTLNLVNNRLMPNAMEPRASIGEYFPGTGDYKLTTTSQNPHLTRLLVAAFVLGIPENKLTVVAPGCGRRLRVEDLSLRRRGAGAGGGEEAGPPGALDGGAVGKFPHRCAWPRPCDEDRAGLHQGRQILAIRTETLANVGAYLSNFSTATPTFLHGTLMAGPYKVPHVYVNVKTVFTNTAPVDAYRGAGRPEATYSAWSG